MTSVARSTPRAHHPRRPSRMRLFVSGGTGVLGSALGPLAATAGHELVMSPKAGRIRFSTFLRVPYSDAGCWSFQAGHHLAVTYSPKRVRALAWSGSVGWGSGSRPVRSIARRSASARRLVGKMPAERCRLPSW